MRTCAYLMARGTDDPWHYPRRELAARTLLALTEGPSKALTLFAPRRRGKTEFLRKDLAPAAEAGGHRVVYVSFWDPLEPLALLVAALERAVAETTLRGRAGTLFGRLLPKVTLSASLPGIEAGGELDLTDLPEKARPALLTHVDALLGRLERADRKTLLLLDEVQELARRDRDEGLVAALRTSLDVRGDGLRTVFTGSSRDGLREMFAASRAPFFHFGTQLDLEPLGDAFVHHMLAQAKRVTGRDVDRDEASAAFEALGRSPYHFRGLVEEMVLRPDGVFADALHGYRARLAEKQGYEALWLRLKPHHRVLLSVLASDAPHPFGTAAATRLRAETGTKAGKSSIQRALAALASDGVIDRWDGRVAHRGRRVPHLGERQ